MALQKEIDFMRRALELARRGEGHTRPNPPVGAVLVKAGKIIGEGYHHRAGQAHAEVEAIGNASKKGASTRGAALYVTLEPCSQAGQVGACTDAIIAAGIKSVVFGVADPNPVNRGKAKKILAKAGISCEKISEKGEGEKLCRDLERLIAPFAKFITTGIPYVTVKIAMSLDGRICDDRGDSRWVSSERARKETGKLREKVDAILVGAWTVRKDDPSLLSHGKPNDDLVRVVVSRSGRLPHKARIFTDGLNKTLVYRDVREAMADLGKRGLMHVLCEGGLGIATSLARYRFVDEWLTVLAPKVIGVGRIADAVVIGKTTCLHDW